MNPNDTIPDRPDPRPNAPSEPYRPTPADMLRLLGESDDEVQKLRSENEALQGALILLQDARESEVSRLNQLISFRTQLAQHLATKLARICGDVGPLLRRYMDYLTVGELPEDESFRMEVLGEVSELVAAIQPYEGQK